MPLLIVKKPKLVVRPKPILRIPLTTQLRNLSPENELLYSQLYATAQEHHDKATRDYWMDNLQTFAKTGNLSLIQENLMYVRTLVPMDEFMFSKTYLGLKRDEVFPSVIEACIELDTGKYVEAILKGALGTGKSTLANLMLARELYKISCMHNPQRSFGVEQRSQIVFTIQSVRFSTAKKAVFEQFGRYIHGSPYFRDVFPYDYKIQSQMMFKKHNVSVMPVSSSDTGAISMNVIGGVLDEVNFLQKIDHSKSSEAEIDGTYDQAKRLYNAIARRRRSRFTKRGKLPGILFVISSSRFPDDFTEKKAAEAKSQGGTDDKIYVYSHSQWSAKSRDSFLPTEFKVVCGNQHIRSKIIANNEPEPPGCQIISVPMDFYSEFQKDIDGSIRDFAGLTTLATKPFIVKRNSIYDCMENASNAGYFNIFNMEEVDLSLGLPKPVIERIRYDVDRPRTCHVDLGLNKDAAGIAIGHVAGLKTIKSELTDGIPQTLPVIAIDFVLRVVPPPNDEIDFASIRLLLCQLVDQYKIPLKWVTFDGFQSTDSRQILRKRGFKVDYLSVEKMEPYRALRDAIYDQRLLLPKHNFISRELAELEQTVKNNKEKVDHRVNGSKDCADAVCGVVSFLLKRREIWGMERVNSSAEGTVLFGDPKVVEKLTHKKLDEQSDLAFETINTGIIRKNMKRRTIPRK